MLLMPRPNSAPQAQAHGPRPSKGDGRASVPVAVQADWQDRRSVNALMRRLERVLTPELLSDDYQVDERYQKLNPTAGHCSAASEALWYMIGSWASPYRKHWAYDTKAARDRQAQGKKRADVDRTHHWLQIPGGEVGRGSAILDPTAEQYTRRRHVDGREVCKEPPYAFGVSAGFMTNVPSKRAQVLIDRVANDLLKRPLKNVSVKPELIWDADADRRKPLSDKLYSGLKEFYADAAASVSPSPRAALRPVGPGARRSGRGARDGRSQPPPGRGPTTAPALPWPRAS
mgnify:CR=1 FL=1